MRTRFLFCALLLVLLSRSTCVTARIADDVVERDGRGIILLAEPFGFGSEGHLDLTVSNLELHRSNVDTNLQGFFITSSQVIGSPYTAYAEHILQPLVASRSDHIRCKQLAFSCQVPSRKVCPFCLAPECCSLLAPCYTLIASSCTELIFLLGNCLSCIAGRGST